MTKRIEKVNSLLEHEIGNILLKDFKFDGALVTLTHVEATANLIEARAYISVLPEENSQKVISALNRNVQNIQRQINKKLNMRPIPKIIFVKDEQIAEAGKIESILSRLKNGQK
ncbi:MAG: 30S ribosome-binding factor RbfA [Patescibacteria group bacterium]